MGLGVAIARFFGPLGKGVFVLLNQIPGFFTMFSNLSIGEALTVLISKNKIKRREVFGTYLLLSGFIICLTMVVYYLSLPFLYQAFWKNAPYEIAKLSCFIIPIVVIEYFGFFCIRGTNNFKLYTRLSIAFKGVSLIAILIYLFSQRGSLLGVVRIYLAIGLINCLVLSYYVAKTSGYAFIIKLSNLKKSFSYGFRVHFGVLLSDLEYRFDIYMLAFFLEPKKIGIYSVAVTISQLSWYAINSINTVLLPTLGAKKSNSSSAEVTMTVCRNTNLLTLLINIGILIFGGVLIKILYGAAFESAYSLLLILLPAILIDSNYRILSSYVKNNENPIILSYFSISSFILNVVLNLILIPRYGIHGAALSSLFSYTVKSSLILIFFVKKNRCSLNKVLLVNSTDLKLYYRGINSIIRQLKLNEKRLKNENCHANPKLSSDRRGR